MDIDIDTIVDDEVDVDHGVDPANVLDIDVDLPLEVDDDVEIDLPSMRFPLR